MSGNITDMSNKGFVLLWSSILDSSVWMQDAPTRLVWITLLAMKDSDGIVKTSVPGLAHRARVTLEECMSALQIFIAPDPMSTSKVEEGRRVREVPGGFFIINHEMYRYSTEERRSYWREQKAREREKKAHGEPPGSKKPLTRSQQKLKADNEARERRYEKASDLGFGNEHLDKIAEGREEE